MAEEEDFIDNAISLEDDLVDTLDNISGSISLEDDAADNVNLLISSERPEKVGVLNADNFFHPSQVRKRKGIKYGKRKPGSVGSVNFTRPIDPTSGTVSSPISFMEETLKLRQLRAPTASVVSMAPTANITIAAESGAEAAGQVVRTSSGASMAVKNFIANRLDGASGLSVLKKFASRKSFMIAGGAAAVGLATSIQTSKNSLKNKEREMP